MDSPLSAIWCYFIRRTYFDNSSLRSRLQSCKISSESDQQSKSTANCRNNGGNPTTEVCLQFFIFLRSLFSLLCSISALRNIVLGKPFGDFLFVPKWASMFLIFLNCSLNPHGLVHFDHLNVTFTINVDFYPPTPRPKYNYDFKKANLIDLKKTLEHIPQSVLLPNADTNISLSNWDDVFWSAFDEFVPKKKARDKLTFTPTFPHPPFPPKNF